MKFFSLAAIVATISTGAFAAPVELYKRCEPTPCLVALGPTTLTCAAALIQGSVNVAVNLRCISGVISNMVNPPDSCDGCVEEFARSVKKTLKLSKAQLGINDIASASVSEEDEDDQDSEVSTSSSRVQVADASSFAEDEEDEGSFLGSGSETGSDESEEGGFFDSLFA